MGSPRKQARRSAVVLLCAAGARCLTIGIRLYVAFTTMVLKKPRVILCQRFEKDKIERRNLKNSGISESSGRSVCSVKGPEGGREQV